jgi:hypothetical protein
MSEERQAAITQKRKEYKERPPALTACEIEEDDVNFWNSITAHNPTSWAAAVRN